VQSPAAYRWQDMLRLEVKCTDGKSLGQVKEIGPNWVMTEKVNEKEMERFYLPKSLVKGFDGKDVKFNITEEQAEKDFMRPGPPGPEEYDIYTTRETSPELQATVPRIPEA
jgi:hypothetical protein